MSKEDNLKPYTPGDSRAVKNGSKGGKNKKGSKHLSTIIKELADDIDWDKTTLNNKDELKEKYGKNGFKAVVYVALTKAMTGDTRAMDWLAKYGYGQKLDITSNENDLFNMSELTIKIVKDRVDDTGNTEPETTNSA
jgi:hypothetical protein